MENEITYIPMDDEFREEIKRRYTRPRNFHMTLLTVIFFGFYLAFLFATDRAWDHIMLTLIAVSIGFMYKAVAFYLTGMFFFLRYKVSYLKDAVRGEIAKEKVHIIKAEHTPAGISIYRVDSESIMTFIPDPHRNFNVGDSVTIYYLENSKEYLAYDFS